MSASWLITDGLSGEANGASKIVTMGLYSGDAPAPPDPTAANNSTRNWLSMGPHLALIVGAGLALGPLAGCMGPGKPLEYTEDPPAPATLQECLHRSLDSLERCEPWPQCYDPKPPAPPEGTP
jgi:hypothetical protein